MQMAPHPNDSWLMYVPVDESRHSPGRDIARSSLFITVAHAHLYLDKSRLVALFQPPVECLLRKSPSLGILPTRRFAVVSSIEYVPEYLW